MDLYLVPKSKEPSKIISVSGAGDWSVYIINQYQFVNKIKSFLSIFQNVCINSCTFQGVI